MNWKMNGPPLDGRADFPSIYVTSRLVNSAIGYLAHIIHNKKNKESKAKQQTKQHLQAY